LECEYRLTQPAVALIMLGTNDVPSTPAAVYADVLREIVEFSILRGVIPALSTIPSFNRTGSEQRPRELNAIVVALALDYQIPLWDFWGATQHLPNQGLSGDGVHPAWGSAPADFSEDNLRQYGGVMRNLLALQMLDSLRTQVMK
jgi:lysophospholipase L1-like esterase